MSCDIQRGNVITAPAVLQGAFCIHWYNAQESYFMHCGKQAVSLNSGHSCHWWGEGVSDEIAVEAYGEWASVEIRIV